METYIIKIDVSDITYQSELSRQQNASKICSKFSCSCRG